MIGFYVTMRRASRTAWLAGPFAEHGEALASVTAAKGAALDLDPRSHWDSFGTARLEAPTLPPGRLNQILGVADLTVDARK